MNVVCHQVTFHNFRLLVPSKLMENLPKMPLERSENLLFPPLQNENKMIFTIPSRMLRLWYSFIVNLYLLVEISGS